MSIHPETPSEANLLSMLQFIVPEVFAPIGGVTYGNSPLLNQWIWEAVSDGTDLDMLEHLKTCKDYKRFGSCDCMLESGKTQFGDWKQSWQWYTRSGRRVAPKTAGAKRELVWVPNENGPNGYAAVYNPNENTIQVVWSLSIYRDAQMASLCYPGQGDIDSEDGGIACYQLPSELSLCRRCKDRDAEIAYYDVVTGSFWCLECAEKENPHGKSC